MILLSRNTYSQFEKARNGRISRRAQLTSCGCGRQAAARFTALGAPWQDWRRSWTPLQQRDSGFASRKDKLHSRHAAVERSFLDGGGAGHFRRRRLARVHGQALAEIRFGLLRAFDKDLEQTARANAVDDIRRAARTDGILDEADKRARLELELFLRQAGFEQVEFR